MFRTVFYHEDLDTFLKFFLLFLYIYGFVLSLGFRNWCSHWSWPSAASEDLAVKQSTREHAKVA